MKAKTPGVLTRIAGALSAGQEKNALVWQPAGRAYPRLAGFDPRELMGRPGLYLLWHLGVRPQWLRVGFSADLGAAATLLAKTPEIAVYDLHDGPFLSWAFCTTQDAPGRVNYLAARLNPAFQHQALACDTPVNAAVPALPCALPAGTKDVQNALNIHADRK